MSIPFPYPHTPPLTKTKIILCLLFGLHILLLAACGTSPTTPPDPVVLQLKWTPSAQFAGFYLAQEKGFYSEENLAVTLSPGGFVDEHVINPVDQVVSGQAQFGIWPGDTLLSARSQGQPVQAVAAIFQINPTAYFSLAEKGIRTPADLAGKRIAYIQESDILFKTVLHSAGLTVEDVEPYPPGFDLTPLLNGEVDVWSGYLTDQVVKLEAQGYRLNKILANDYGGFVYSDLLFTTDQMIAENPDLVQRFVRASLRGWKYALEHPEEAVSAILKADPANASDLKGEMQASIPLIDTGQVPLGWMDDVVWQTTQTLMLEANLLPAPIDLSQIYTTEFLQH